MQNKIKDLFKDKEATKSCFGTLASPVIYIIDKKKEENGDIHILPTEDFKVKAVELKNENNLRIFYYIFQDYSFKKERLNENKITGFEPLNSENCYRHCECILFPDEVDTTNNWTLLVETKYAKDYRAASEKKNDYPHSMVEQINSTSEYLRRHGVIPLNKMVNAIVAFPNLIINYEPHLFKGNIYREDENKIDIRKPSSCKNMSITQIAKKYKVIIQAQNGAIINNREKLAFASL
jgi:hypothetical protein